MRKQGIAPRVSHKGPTISAPKGKGRAYAAAPAPAKSTASSAATSMRQAAKSLETQGLQAIEMLNQMNAMLDMQISYAADGRSPSEQMLENTGDKRPGEKKASTKDMQSRAVRDIQAKNSQIRSILDGISGSGQTGGDYQHLMQLDAIFSASGSDSYFDLRIIGCDSGVGEKMTGSSLGKILIKR